MKEEASKRWVEVTRIRLKSAAAVGSIVGFAGGCLEALSPAAFYGGAPGEMIIITLALPFLGALLSSVLFLLIAAIYNLGAEYIGGLVFELREPPRSSGKVLRTKERRKSESPHSASELPSDGNDTPEKDKGQQ